MHKIYNKIEIGKKNLKKQLSEWSWWVENYPDQAIYESIRKELKVPERNRMIKLLLELKKGENG